MPPGADLEQCVVGTAPDLPRETNLEHFDHGGGPFFNICPAGQTVEHFIRPLRVTNNDHYFFCRDTIAVPGQGLPRWTSPATAGAPVYRGRGFF